MKNQSNALWPADVYKGMYGDSISTDTHRSEEDAQAICRALEREGFGGGERKHFPLKTWTSEEQQPPKLPQ